MGPPGNFQLVWTEKATDAYNQLVKDPSLSKRLKAVRKALGYLQVNPKHQSLQTHKYSAFQGPNGEEVFEAYAENHTPGAYRVFWFYGPSKGKITILCILPHP